MESNDIFADAKARRGRWEKAQECWRNFVQKLLVEKQNFLFKRDEGEVIFTEESFRDVMERYIPLRTKNQIDSFKEGVREQYGKGKAGSATRLVFAHVLFAYKIIEKAEEDNDIKSKKEFVGCLGDLDEFKSDIYWEGFAGTGSGYYDFGESVGLFLDAINFAIERKKADTFEGVNKAIGEFCENNYTTRNLGDNIGERQTTDAMLWYVAPEKYEPIIAITDKRRIAKKLKKELKNPPNNLSKMIENNFEVNKVVSMIRQSLVERIGRADFSFYDADVKRLWKDDKISRNEEDFRNWLAAQTSPKTGKLYSDSSVDQYARPLRTELSKLAKKLNLIPARKTFYDMQVKTEFDDVRKKLEEHPEFKEIEKDRHGTNPAALQHYGDFLAQKKPIRQFGTQEKGRKTMEQHPLNQIFYGPPGTGKTYGVVEAALEIIGCNVPEGGDERERRKSQMALFNKLLNAGQIAMVTFHQNFSYEDFIEGIRPVLASQGEEKNETQSDNLSYKLEDGIFKEIAAPKSISTEAATVIVELYAQKVASIIENGGKVFLKGEGKWEVEGVRYVGDKLTSFKIKPDPDSRKPQPLTADDAISTYQRYVSGDVKSPGDVKLNKNGPGRDHYYFALIERISELKRILIIDEINRGNISAIFGELITLLEDDKRLGAENELRLKLPYSKEYFGVPSNLHIIGTMNTADRSIALLDTALRRRFHFVERMPDLEQLLKKDVEDVNLGDLLREINERIREAHGREHQIGHAYFMGVENIPDLKKVFQHKIIPLLQEYFHDNWKKIAKVVNNDELVKPDGKVESFGKEGEESAWDKAVNYKKISDKRNLNE